MLKITTYVSNLALTEKKVPLKLWILVCHIKQQRTPKVHLLHMYQNTEPVQKDSTNYRWNAALLNPSI